MMRVTGPTVALLAAMAVAPVLAQQTTGIITGIVTDAQGGAIAGVTVTVTSTSTGLSRSSVTNTQGLYQLGPLPSGTYDLVTAAAGFAPVERHALAGRARAGRCGGGRGCGGGFVDVLALREGHSRQNQERGERRNVASHISRDLQCQGSRVLDQVMPGYEQAPNGTRVHRSGPERVPRKT